MPLNIRLLGRFEFNDHAQELDVLHSPRLQALLAYLLLNREMPLPRARVAATLWPDTSVQNGRNNLRRLLHRLRRHLPDGCLDLTPQTIQWRPDVTWTLDVAAFETACRHAADLSGWQTAVNLYGGPLLPDLYDDWLLDWRERLRQQWLDALTQLAAQAVEAKTWETAVSAAQTLLQEEPLRETHYRRLMRLHQAQGDRAAALRVYQTCVDVLQTELSVPPAAATRALHSALLQQEPPPAALPRPATSDPPTYRTPLFGRTAEIARLRDLLLKGDLRLLTITGSGGIGKTRLAVHMAQELAQNFRDGVVFVWLASVPRADLLLPTLATACGLALSGQQPPETQLAAALRSRQSLIVLDNFEHLMDGRALLGRLAAATPDCRWLVTARARLNLRAEQVFRLDGLATPAAPHAELSQTWQTIPAVRLFIATARRGRLDFVPDSAEWAAISAICDFVAGHPLAIELAASWTRFLGSDEILRRLKASADLPDAPFADAPARQRSMATTFDYSWQTLSPAEQDALPKLAAFQGSFSAAAAAEIAGVPLGLLVGLVDKSLLQTAVAGRFDMHPLLHQFAAQRLEQATTVAESVHARHAEHYRAAVCAQAAELTAARRRGENPTQRLADIRADIDNVRAAWQWLRQHSEAVAPADVEAFVDSFGLFLAFESWYQEALNLYTTALETFQPPPLVVGKWQRQLATAVLGLGQATRAAHHLRRSLALLSVPFPGNVPIALGSQLLQQTVRRLLPGRILGSHRARRHPFLREAVRAYDTFSRVHFYSGERQAFAYSAVRALNLAEQVGDQAVEARHLANMCMGLAFAGRHRWARSYRQRAHALAAVIDDAPSQAYVYLVTGVYDGMVGAWMASQRALEQAAEIYWRLGDSQQWGECQAILCTNLYAQGRFQAAVPSWELLIERAQEVGNRLQRSWGTTGLSGTLLILNRLEPVPALLESSLETLRTIDSPQNMMSTQGFRAVYLSRQKRWAEALEASDAVLRYQARNRATFTTIVVALSSAAELYLDLLDAETAVQRAAGIERGDLLHRADAITAGLQQFARAVTAGEPRASLYRGRYLWHAGQSRRALRLWQRGLVRAQALNMPYDAGRLCHALWQHLDPDDARRTDYLAQALRTFAELNTTYDLARVQREL